MSCGGAALNFIETTVCVETESREEGAFLKIMAKVKYFWDWIFHTHGLTKSSSVYRVAP